MLVTMTLVELYRALGGGWDISDQPRSAPPPPPALGPPLAPSTLLENATAAVVPP